MTLAERIADMTLADLHPDAFYSAAEVAEVFRISVDSVYGMTSRGLLSAVRLGPHGGKLGFRGAVIIEYAEKRAA